MTDALQPNRALERTPMRPEGARAVRPRNAATLFIIRRDGARPRVLMGKRHGGHNFMPNLWVFPGGRIDRADFRAPTATDLRTVLTVMKIAASLERCGDYAKNLGKRSNVLAQMNPIAGAAGSIRRMAKQVQLLLKDALDAYISRDAALAADVRLRDREVDQMYNALFREFLTHMMEDPRNITACMHLHFIAKNIERVGDHATGIAEQVIYLVTGEVPADPRPKADGLAPVMASED